MSGSPHPALRPYLAHDYVGITEATDQERGLLLPATTSVLMIVKIQDSPLRPPAFVNGVHGSFSVIDGACSPSYLEVRLSPLGAFGLLGLPMDELNDKIVDLKDILGADGRLLGDTTRDAPTWARRFQVLDGFLLGRLAQARLPAPEVVTAWARLEASAGAVPIGRIAKDVGWSHKHLITRFRQQIGLSPKTAARLLRFERVSRQVTEDPGAPWAQVAADAGYTDQAHLVRDFRQFTGSAPTAYLARSDASGRAPAYR